MLMLVKNSRFLLALFIIAHTLYHTPLRGDTRIVAYLQNAPAAVIQQVEHEAREEKLLEKIDSFDQKNPGYFGKQLLKSHLRTMLTPSVGGILALYAGYSDYSNADGLIAFPLRHATPKIYIAITQAIVPVMAVGNAVSHLEFYNPAEIPADFFELNKKEDEVKQTYWEVKKIALPENNKIPLTTLIILTKPENIIIPTGACIAEKSNHLIVPPIYLVGNNSYVDTISKLLDIQQYFEPIDCIVQKSGDFVIQSRVTNL